MSPLTAILCLVALITTPIISYTFFMAIRCPRNPFRRGPACGGGRLQIGEDRAALQRQVQEDGGGEPCPVCLSVFAEGEEIRQLSACIDVWLYSHWSCPVSRAAVPVKRSKKDLTGSEDDFRHGLPDAATLI